MAKVRSKEPLLAVLLSVVLVGLGQIYSARVLRGAAFFVIRLILVSASLYFIFSPGTKINSSLYLLLLISLAFQIFAIVDSYFCAKAYNRENRLKRQITMPKRVALVAAIILLVFVFNPSHAVPLYIKANVVQPVKIADGGMSPVILKGDTIFVDKAVYKKSGPARADVVVFKRPDEFAATYTARVIALPGESVEIKGGKVIINGSVLQEPAAVAGIYYENKGTKGQEGGVTKVPAGSYFILGDNSVSSKDSRFFGCIGRKSILGKAYKIFLPRERSGIIK